MRLEMRLEWTVVKSARNVVTNFSATIYDRFITQISSSFSSSLFLCVLSSSQAYFFHISYNTVGVEGLSGLLRRPHRSVESANWEYSMADWARPISVEFTSLFIFFVPSLFLPPPTLLSTSPPPRPLSGLSFFFLFLCEFSTCLEDNGFICCRASDVSFASEVYQRWWSLGFSH